MEEDEDDEFDDDPYEEVEEENDAEELTNVPLGQFEHNNSKSSLSLDESYNEIDENS